MSAIAVAHRPGLAGSLLVGLTAAKSLALALDVPLIGVDHLQAHIYACRMAAGRNVFPCVGMIVSGGHSHLYRCATPLDFTPLGGTIDDAAGECFRQSRQHVGPRLPRRAGLAASRREGRSQTVPPAATALGRSDAVEFSFSGLKTAVRYQLYGPGRPQMPGQLDPQTVADMAAGVQAAIIDCVTNKAILALKRTGFTRLCVGGGVAANRPFRERLEQLAAERGFELFIPPLSLCTDNAAMGAIAVERFLTGQFDALDLDIAAGLERPQPA